MLEVSIEGRTRTKSSTGFHLLDTVEDHHDDIEPEVREDPEDKDEAKETTYQTGTKSKKRTRSISRVNYAYLHRYGRREKDGDVT